MGEDTQVVSCVNRGHSSPDWRTTDRCDRRTHQLPVRAAYNFRKEDFFKAIEPQISQKFLTSPRNMSPFEEVVPYGKKENKKKNLVQAHN